MSVDVRPLRIVLGKIGLDGHDRGLKIIARLLRESGHEVVYLGRRRQPEELVRAAVQEDADALGVSFLSGTHENAIGELVASRASENAEFLLVAGGTILQEDIPALLERGVAAVFPVGTPLNEIRAYFDQVKRES